MTALQENPVYDIDDGAIDMGIFKGDRDVSELELYDSGEVVGPPSHCGTIDTGMSKRLSTFQHPGGPHVQNGHSLRLSNNMELVSADVSLSQLSKTKHPGQVSLNLFDNVINK